MAKHPTSFRLSRECLLLIEQLAERLGINQTAVVEEAVRKFARVELRAVKVEELQRKPKKEK